MVRSTLVLKTIILIKSAWVASKAIISLHLNHLNQLTYYSFIYGHYKYLDELKWELISYFKIDRHFVWKSQNSTNLWTFLFELFPFNLDLSLWKYKIYLWYNCHICMRFFRTRIIWDEWKWYAYAICYYHYTKLLST